MHVTRIFSHMVKTVAVASAIILPLSGCTGREFSVEGTVEQGATRTLILERQDPVTGWLALDSVKIGRDGSFRFTSPAPECPELYRLTLAGRSIYLPVDSLEQLTLTAHAAHFDTGFTLSGSEQARSLTAFEREAVRVQGYGNADSVQVFRKRVFNRYLRNSRGSILSYYILMRPMGDGFLIDYTDPLYTAVATAFATYRPDDPHTAQLAARARQGQLERRRAAGKGVRMRAVSSGVVPIELPGLDGKVRKLSDMLGQGRPVIVAFVLMSHKDTPPLNRQLRKLYDAGMADVYEVCLDADQFAWRQASAALPWTVVLDPDGAHSRVALNYNVGSLPAFFIYNAAGDLVQSTCDVSQLESLL